MDDVDEALAAARDAYRRRDWTGARERLLATRARRLRELGRRHADPNMAAAGDLFEGRAPWSRPAGSPRRWACSTRPCWPYARASSA